MNEQLIRQVSVYGKRIQLVRRRQLREQPEDRTLTDTWPPRLNTKL